jgi:hypothetical protein
VAEFNEAQKLPSFMMTTRLLEGFSIRVADRTNPSLALYAP